MIGKVATGIALAAMLTLAATAPAAGEPDPSSSPGVAVSPGPTASGAPGSTAPGADSEPAAAPVVRLTSMTPSVLRPGATLRVRGRVVNTNSTQATAVSVQLRLSAQPLQSRSEVSEVAAGTSTRVGEPVAGTSTQVTSRLDPGQSADFTLRVPVADIGLGINGVYALHVQALGTIDQVPQALGQTSVPVPWFAYPSEIKRSRIVVLWPITAPVDELTGTKFLSNDLAAQFAVGGRLRNRVEAAGSSTAALSWVIDPAVTDAATTMATGYTVVRSGGAALESADARTWLEQLSAAARSAGSDRRLLPYGQVDAEAVVRAGQASDVAAAVAASRSIAQKASLDVTADPLAMPPSGSTTNAALAAYLDNGVDVAVLSDAFLPPAPDLTYTPTGLTRLAVGDRSMTVAISDQRLASALPTAESSATERLIDRQLLLSDTAMITAEQPVSARTVVLQPPDDFDAPVAWTARLLKDLGTAPWTEVVPLSSLLADTADPVQRADPKYTDRPDELTQQHVQRIPALQQRAASLAEVLVRPGDVAEQFERACLRSLSAQWRNDEVGGGEFLDALSAQLTDAEAGIRVISSGKVTLSGRSGIVPITLANDLTGSVQVSVRLKAEPQVRLQYQQPDLLVIAPGRRSSLDIPVDTFGTGPLPVEISLVDRTGSVFGQTQSLELRPTAGSTISIVVIVLGGLALALLVGIRIVRGRRGGESDNS